jgi:Tfp pilus assembly protein PilF
LNALFAWILLPLLPVLYIKVFSASELAHDRYLYVSSVGYCLLVVYAFRSLAQRIAIPATVWKSVVAAVLVLQMGVTVSGELYWASDLLLFKHALEVAPQNESAAVNLGIMYAEHQRPDLAEPLLRGVFERSPNSAAAAYNYGELLAGNHQWAMAEPIMKRALQIDPRNDRWWMEFANVELTLGKIAEAQAAAQEAVRLRPDGFGYHAVLAVIAYKLGDRENAAREFREELTHYPENQAALSGLRELGSAVR